MQKADKNASGRVSWLEFREAVEEWRNECGSNLEIIIEGFEAFQCDYNHSGGQLIRLIPKSANAHEYDAPIDVVVECGVSEVGSIITVRSPLTIKNSCHKSTEVLFSNDMQVALQYIIEPNCSLSAPLQVHLATTMLFAKAMPEQCMSNV